MSYRFIYHLSWLWIGVPALAMFLPFSSTGLAFQPEEDEGVLTLVPKGRVWKGPQGMGQAEILALAFIDDDRNCLAVLVEEPGQPKDIRERILSFYFRKQGRFVEIYRFTTPNFFETMYPTGEGTRLITTWATGSGHRTGIFAIVNGAVQVVFWIGWNHPPQFVDLDGDGETEIIHAIPVYPSSKTPEVAEIYKWDGHEYKLLRSVPWTRRFEIKTGSS